jgi:hypothetical protein
VGFDVVVKDGEAEEDLEGRLDRERVAVADVDFEDLREFVPVGEAVDVFELVIVEVSVFERPNEIVDRDDELAVFEVSDDTVGWVDELAVLEIVPVFVLVMVDVVVFVDVGEGETRRVGKELFVPVVVFVEVLLAVDVGDAAKGLSSKIRL